MASAFDRLDRLNSRSVERAFGEPVRFLPQKVTEYFAAADPDRESFDLTAIVTVEHAGERLDGQRNAEHSTPSIAGGEVRISVDAARFGDNPPRKGDRFQALKRPGQPLFEVTLPAPDNATRILLHCTRVKT